MWKWCRTGRQGWRPSVISAIWSMCARVYALLIGGPPGMESGPEERGDGSDPGDAVRRSPGGLPRVVELRHRAELGGVVRTRKRLVGDGHAQHRAERPPAVGGPPFHQAIGCD